MDSTPPRGADATEDASPRSSRHPLARPGEDPLRPEMQSPSPEDPVGPQAPARPSPLPEARVVPSAVTSASPPASEADSLSEEAALLQSAYQSLASNPAESLALAETHATKFPGGKLGMEREIVSSTPLAGWAEPRKRARAAKRSSPAHRAASTRTASE